MIQQTQVVASCSYTAAMVYSPLTLGRAVQSKRVALFAIVAHPRALYNHLRNALAAERLAALELLALEAGERVEHRGQQQEDGRHNQARRHGPDADPLYGAHDKVDGGAHVVGAEFADKLIELGRRGTDAEEERYLDEDDDKRTHPALLVRTRGRRGRGGEGRTGRRC